MDTGVEFVDNIRVVFDVPTEREVLRCLHFAFSLSLEETEIGVVPPQKIDLRIELPVQRGQHRIGVHGDDQPHQGDDCHDHEPGAEKELREDGAIDSAARSDANDDETRDEHLGCVFP